MRGLVAGRGLERPLVDRYFREPLRLAVHADEARMVRGECQQFRLVQLLQRATRAKTDGRHAGLTQHRLAAQHLDAEFRQGRCVVGEEVRRAASRKIERRERAQPLRLREGRIALVHHHEP